MAKKNSFLKGAAILVMANFIVKIIGVVYKIPLTNIMGGEGMGYFSSAFDVYLMLFSLSTAGLPVALSRMVAESHSLKRYSEITKIIKVTFCIFLTIGLFGAVLMYFGAGVFSSFISNDLAKYSLMALSPSLFFICIMSIFRGYFQGLQDMKPTAISQVFEALVKLIAGISLALFAVSIGLSEEYISSYAILGTTISTVVSVMILAFIFTHKKNKKVMREFKEKGGAERSSKQIVTDLIKIVIPVTIGSVVVNLTGFLDLFLIINRLQENGLSPSEANFIYGSYKACAYTIFNLPTSIIATFNVTLIPVIATAFAKKDVETLNETVAKSIRITAIFALPCAVAFIVFSNPILNLMYPGMTEEIAIASPLLQSLGVAVTFVTMASMFTAILQAVGREKVPVRSILIASIAKISLNYILIGIPSINILGATIGTTVCYFIILALNYNYIQRKTIVKVNFWNTTSKPLISAIIMGVLCKIVFVLLETITKSQSITMILTIPVAVIVYFVTLILVGGIRKSDIEGLPFSRRVSRFFHD